MTPLILPLAAAVPPAAAKTGSWTLLFVYFSLAIGVSFICSVWEAVLLSISQPYIEHQKSENPKTGAMLERLKSDINAPLTSILTLNTIAHTVGAMGVGGEVVALVGGGWLEGLAGALMTLAILILSEIIPKNLGARHWRSWAPQVGTCLSVLSMVMKPFVKMIACFSPGGHSNEEFSREELRVMGEMGRRQGKLLDNELQVLSNLLVLRDYTVQDVMTPRTVIFALPESMTIAGFMESHSHAAFSRIPIYRQKLDDPTGYILKSDALLAAADDRHTATLADFRRDVLRFPDTMPLPRAFDQFVSGKNHIALVQDEYGGIDGLVTLEDIVETLLGLEIMDEKDTREDMRQWARQLWKRRATDMGLNLDASGEPITEPITSDENESKPS